MNGRLTNDEAACEPLSNPESLRVDMNSGIQFAVSAGCALHMAAKNTAEIIRVSETTGFGNFLDDHIAIKQVSTRGPYPTVVDSPGQRIPKRFPINPAQIIGVVTERLGYRTRCDRTIEIQANIRIGSHRGDADSAGVFLF